MSVQAKGDFAKLQRIVAKLVHKNALRELNAVLAEEGLELVAEGFEAEKDPSGRDWKPTLRGGSILRDTGRLARSFTRKVTTTGFRIGTNVLYAKTHQFGAVIVPTEVRALRFRHYQNGQKKQGRWVFAREVTIPARPMLPEGGLSPRWQKALSDAAHEVVIAWATK